MTPSPKNRVLIAAAGSGKTTLVARDAVAKVRRALVLTFTNQNQNLLAEAIAAENHGFPSRAITVMGWFSFLINEFIRPYQRAMTEVPDLLNSLNFKGRPQRFVPRSNLRHFIDGNQDVFRDSAADLACEVDRATSGASVRRLESMFDAIYVDEVQDLHGYDLEVLELLFASRMEILLVGDPRQSILETNIGPKNRKYAGAGILNWFEERKKVCAIEHVTYSRRCNQAICDFADKLFPEFKTTQALDSIVTGHDGVMTILRRDVANYCREYSPVVLRENKTTNTLGLSALNIGITKGMTFNRVLVFPSKTVAKYIKSGSLEGFKSRERLYVAATRARHSVAFVMD